MTRADHDTEHAAELVLLVRWIWGVRCEYLEQKSPCYIEMWLCATVHRCFVYNWFSFFVGVGGGHITIDYFFYHSWVPFYIHYKVWDEITYPFLNFNGATTYPCWDWTMLVKGAPGHCDGADRWQPFLWKTRTRVPQYTWWRHKMEIFSALLALCVGNSPVTGEFPSQRPVTRSFSVLFDVRLNKLLSKQSTRRWSKTPLRSLCRHCNVANPWLLIP